MGPLRGPGSEGSEGVVAASPQIKKRGGAAGAAGCVEGLCSLPLRGQQPFGLRVVVSPLGR